MIIYHRRHENLIVLRKNRVIGGITYRLFEDRNFVEIVFCTVATDEQIHVEEAGLSLIYRDSEHD